MANLFSNIAGLGLATYIGQSQRKDDFKRNNALRVQRGLKELPWEDAPIDKAMTWVGDKFKSITAPEVAKAPEVAAAAPVSPGGSEDVGLWERLKAGNIDQEGSEAYNRWGAGAKKMDAELESASDSFKDLPSNTGFSKADFTNAPNATATAESKWNDAMKPTEGFLDNQ